MNKLVDFLKYNNYKVSIERKSFLLIIIFSLFIISCNYNSSLDYHITKKIPVVDTYFETEIIDNYRWLEDDMSSETEDWVSKQNELTYDYLNKIPFRDELKTRLSDLWNYEKISAPFKEGEYTYFYKNSGLQNQMVLYRQLGDNNPEVFLDPNTFSIDGTTSF